MCGAGCDHTLSALSERALNCLLFLLLLFLFPSCPLSMPSRPPPPLNLQLAASHGLKALERHPASWGTCREGPPTRKRVSLPGYTGLNPARIPRTQPYTIHRTREAERDHVWTEQQRNISASKNRQHQCKERGKTSPSKQATANTPSPRPVQSLPSGKAHTQEGHFPRASGMVPPGPCAG